MNKLWSRREFWGRGDEFHLNLNANLNGTLND